MPRLKMTADEKTKTVLLANIDYFRRMKGITDEEFEIAGRMSKSTYYRRLREPDTFLLSELMGISKKLGVSLTRLFTEVGVLP